MSFSAFCVITSSVATSSKTVEKARSDSFRRLGFMKCTFPFSMCSVRFSFQSLCCGRLWTQVLCGIQLNRFCTTRGRLTGPSWERLCIKEINSISDGMVSIFNLFSLLNGTAQHLPCLSWIHFKQCACQNGTATSAVIGALRFPSFTVAVFS